MRLEELVDWGEMRVALDHLAQNRRHIVGADHETRQVRDDPHSANTWGILPPRTYFRFDAAALEAEDEQAWAYGKEIRALP